MCHITARVRQWCAWREFPVENNTPGGLHAHEADRGRPFERGSKGMRFITKKVTLCTRINTFRGHKIKTNIYIYIYILLY